MELPLPGKKIPNSNPHSLAFDREGIIFFTTQESNFVGKLDPKTGKITLNPKTKSFQHWPIPSGGGVVRNMVATPDDKLYVACSGVNKVAIVEVTR